ncbi:Nicotinamide-nucleotide amidohydrolase PncC [Roseovarius litorisediminis]|uniref:Nicotinamide-nucleotide amidohydrolase PncC n=1 Tax=Roseovarius litorisediminis TaxID=1312363 RepID=A0A1Y5REE4_9RHOB|nr:CinA family protein [Roseovarius litorisediminis]SLN12749.1 Nicotinamide-nucleotide amidohydrolase PncC [Roseovarius litorisediminis]
MTTSAQLLMRARDKGLRIATAESCTGGMLSAEITKAAGSSDIFDRGFVTYSNAAKQDMLGVTDASLKAYGAVSEQVAIEMADGALARSVADLALSVTGIAGPGGSDSKPEGRVCFALARKGAKTKAHTVEFGALGRENVRQASTAYALDLLIQAAT